MQRAEAAGEINHNWIQVTIPDMVQAQLVDVACRLIFGHSVTLAELFPRRTLSCGQTTGACGVSI